MTSPTRADIWKTFSEIKQTKNLQSDKTGDGEAIAFVNWMDTLAEARKHYPQISWEHWTYDNGGEVFYFADKTAEVKATIFIDEVEHSTTLPVTDQSWAPIVNPNANDINTAKKRCLCKALGELGLFWQLWSVVERDGFVQKSTVREAANDSVVTEIKPKVAVNKEESNLDSEVLIQQEYNRLYDLHLKTLRNRKTFQEELGKVCNNLRNKFGKDVFDDRQTARAIKTSYNRKKWEVPRGVLSNVG